MLGKRQSDSKVNRSPVDGDTRTGIQRMKGGSCKAIGAALGKQGVPFTQHLPRLKGMNYCIYFLFATRQNFGEDDK
jgi:hypothetical protein